MKNFYDYYPFSEKETGLNVKLVFGLIITNKNGIILNKHTIKPIFQVSKLSNWDLDNDSFFIEIESQSIINVIEGNNTLSIYEMKLIEKWIETNYFNILALMKQCIIGKDWLKTAKHFIKI